MHDATKAAVTELENNESNNTNHPIALWGGRLVQVLQQSWRN